MTDLEKIKQFLVDKRAASPDFNEVCFLNGIIEDDIPILERGNVANILICWLGSQSLSRHLSPIQYRAYVDLLNELRPMATGKEGEE